MTELNELYSPKFEKQLKALNDGFAKLVDDLNDSATGLKKVDDSLREVEKTRENLNKQLIEAEKIKQQVIKTDTDLIKKQQQSEKINQEAQKSYQAKIKSEQEVEKLKQQKLKTMDAERKKTNAQTKAQKSLLDEYRTEIKTAKQATLQNTRLRKIRENLDTTSKHYIKKLDATNKLINRNNTLTKSQADADKQRTLNIGKYNTATEKTNVLIEQVVENTGEMGQVVGGAVGKVKKMGSAFKAMLLNPVVLLLAGIAAAVIVMSKAIMNNRQAQEKWQESISATKTTWNAFSASLSEEGGMERVWKNMWEIGKVAQALTKDLIALGREAAIYGGKIENALMKAEKFKSIADDATLSFKKRQEAADKSIELEIKAYDKKIDLTAKALQGEIDALQNVYGAELSVSQLKDKIKQDELDRFVELQVAYARSLNDRERAEMNYNKLKRELALDVFEQELDFIFDVADKRKTANEKLIADDELTFEQKKGILDQTNKLLNDSFDEQIDLFETNHAIQIDTNKLLNLNNLESARYAMGLGMSERATNRLLEVIRERIAATSDLDEAEKDLNKSHMDSLKNKTKETDAIIKGIRDELRAELDVSDLEADNHDDVMKYIQEEDDAKKKADQDELDRIANRQQALSEGFNMAVDAANILIDMNQMRFEEQLMQLDVQHEREILLAGDNELAKRGAERRFAVEQAKIQKKQAESEKKQALFNIAINTAVNVARVSWNPFLVAGVIALGGIQALAVAKQPIPEVPAFDKGSSRLPSGTLAVAERRPEIISHKGKTWLQKSPLLTNKLTGARVMSGANTDLLMRSGNVSDSDIMMHDGFRQIKDSIDNIKIEVGYNNKGQAYVIRQQKNKITYANYYN